MKIKIYDLLNSIFCFIAGIFFIIFPEVMIQWIGIILGIYLVLKAILCLFTNTSPFRNTLVITYVLLSALTIVLWQFFLQFIMVLFGIIVTLMGLMKFSSQDISINKKGKVWNIVTALFEIVGGIAIIVISFMNVYRVLGIITGTILILISVLLLINDLDKRKWTLHHETSIENNSKDVIDAEIVTETTEDIHD